MAMSKTVPPGALRPADVLLYEGTGWLARLIRFFDGTDFNHAGLCIGDGSVAEAQAPGVIRQGVEPSVAGRVKVLVRRLKRDVSLDPVVVRGLQVVDEGHRYAFEQLLLLAFLGLTRKLKATPILKTLLRKVLDRAASVATGIVAAGKEPMICSEFVYRCYDEALPEAADVYSLEVNPGAEAFTPTASWPGVSRPAPCLPRHGASAGRPPRRPRATRSWPSSPSVISRKPGERPFAPARRASRTPTSPPPSTTSP
jgi:hypothetical protein